MYATFAKHTVRLTMQTSVNLYIETSCAYNTVNHCQSSKYRICESKFVSDVIVTVSEDIANDDSKYYYFARNNIFKNAARLNTFFR